MHFMQKYIETGTGECYVQSELWKARRGHAILIISGKFGRRTEAITETNLSNFSVKILRQIFHYNNALSVQGV